jgi:2-oxoglutarate ferredoxin oxidoreductase subunit gamma
MRYEILIVGRGGQGVLLLGRILGVAASKYAGLHATVTEAYAAETRGGESRSDVIIASSIYEAPYIKVLNADMAIFMFPFRVDEYKKLLKESSIVVVDEEYVNPELFKGYKLISARFGEIAEKATGTRRVTNIVILGRIIKELKSVGISEEHARRALEELVPPRWLQLNIKAFEEGLKLP